MRLKYDVECMKMADRFVAVPVGEDADSLHGVLKLNESAASIIKLLKDDKSEAEIVEALLSEYDAPREVIESAVHRCIAELESKGLLA